MRELLRKLTSFPDVGHCCPCSMDTHHLTCVCSKVSLVTLVTLSCDVVLLMAVTRLVSTGLPSRSQEKLKVVVPTQSPPVQVSVRGSPTLRTASEPTEGGVAQWKAERGGEGIDRAKEGTRVGQVVRLVK